MKYLNKSIYAFALVGMMGLWSCSQEDVLQGGDVTAKGHQVPVTLTVNRSDAQTRTILSENTATGGLNSVWETGDVLAVYNSAGEKAGELVISEGAGTDTGIFTGTVTSENGQYDFNLWYTDPENTGADKESGKPLYFATTTTEKIPALVVDLSKMPKYTSVDALSAMDVLSKKVKLNINGNNATLVQDETMQAHLAMARFSLNGIPTGKTGTLTIKDNNNSILYKKELGLSAAGAEKTVSAVNGIIIDGVKAGEDIYLAFIPSTYTLSFHMEFEGLNYDYAFTNPTKLEAGVYYNVFTKAEGAEEGKIDGVNIPLKQETLAALHLYANFDGADPEEIVIYKKFENGAASFDLTKAYEEYVGTDGMKLPAREGYTFLGWNEDENATSKGNNDVITIDTPNYPNQYYYAIWEKVPEIDHSLNPLAKWAKGDLVRSGSGKSVRGTVSDDPWTSGSYYQFGRNYGYNSASEVTLLSTEMSLSNNYFTFRGTSYKTTPENGVYSASSKMVQQNQNATSLTTISDHPSMFFMNGGDYITPGYTENWATRAKTTNGYTYETPCPDGWTIPTRADFEAILPNSNNKVGSTTWDTLTEVKLIGEDEIPCAFRWSKEGNALKIESLMLATKESTPDWTDDNVVIRYFTLSGCLTSFMQSGNLTQGSTSTVQYVANVLNFGKYDTVKTLGSSSGWTNVYYMKTTKLADYMGDTGFYWTSDAEQQVFTLNTNSNISSYPNVGYYFTKSSVTIGANIRCIRK